MAGLVAEVNQRPENLFFACGDMGLSFAATNQLVARTCGAILRHTPLEPGDKVAILMAAPPPFILTLFALMRMRVISVPLNTRLTAGELAWQVKNTDCRLVICEGKTRALAREVGATVMEMPNIDREAPGGGIRGIRQDESR